nr:MAG TPA: hypothetical protein [Caudoviricetes sp.]
MLLLFQHCFNITKFIYCGSNIQNRGVLKVLLRQSCCLLSNCYRAIMA